MLGIRHIVNQNRKCSICNEHSNEDLISNDQLNSYHKNCLINDHKNLKKKLHSKNMLLSMGIALIVLNYIIGLIFPEKWDSTHWYSAGVLVLICSRFETSN